MSKYRDLGIRSVSLSHAIGLSCHHCKVQWAGCAAECCCPECGAEKGYHSEDWDECYCHACIEERACSRCDGEGWLEPIGPYSDGSYITSRPCPNCDGSGRK